MKKIRYNMEGLPKMDNFKAEIDKKCTEEDFPCALTFKIQEKLQTFTDVIGIFSSRGFTVKEFVDDYMCIMSRDNEGFNEAIKIKDYKIQIQAMKDTIVDLCDELSQYCTGIGE